MKYDVTIIGAGVVGCLIARALSRFELRTCLIDRESDVSMGTSKANSGIIHAGYAAKCGSLKALLNVRGNRMMEHTAAELSVPFRRVGSLVLAFGEGDLATLEALRETGVRNGVPNMRIIDRNELAEREPSISGEAIAALSAPTAGIISPYELTIGAAENAVANGVELLLEHEVTDITTTGDGFIVTAGGETIETRYLINAAGVFADKIAAMASDDAFHITARRGEYMLLDKSRGSTVKSVIFQPPTQLGKGILVTPTVDGNLLVGPTAVNQEDRDDVSTTAEGLAAAAKGALKSVPGLSLRDVINSFAGLRAVPDSRDFIIEASKNVRNLIHVAGIESPGLSASPAIAEYVVSILDRAGLRLYPKHDFNPVRRPIARFADMTNEEKADAIRRNPLYANILCRCEQVTEGEIVEAIHRPAGARNLDAVKRRTRQGMGRCQGGFCMPRVIGILARELGIPEEEVTKSGGQSQVVVGRVK